MSERFFLLKAKLATRVACVALILVHLHRLFVDLDRRRRRTEEEFLAYVILG